MELKTNYQYTYFIHPFVVAENKYQKYILNLIKDKRFTLKVFQKNKDIDLSFDESDNNLVITIKDYGPGIPENIKDKLFKEVISTKGKNGTGLGLYMSYSTIKVHFHGNLTFESEKDMGTTFYIKVPI